MNLHEEWTDIRHLFARSFYASMATVDAEGRPHVTTIGSLLLHRDIGKGFWFERFTTALPRHLEADPHVCAMAVDTRLSLWGRALVTGRFHRAPGVRLVGQAGARRAATDHEMALFERRVRRVRWTRGYRLLWQDFGTGREVTFDRAVSIRLGRMWPPRKAATV